MIIQFATACEITISGASVQSADFSRPGLESEAGRLKDAVCRRIRILVEEHLQLIGGADGGWSRLYLDPADERYWELTYPQSEMHGGGPPQLVHISADAAKIKYGVD